jgi:hypothetical protein
MRGKDLPMHQGLETAAAAFSGTNLAAMAKTKQQETQESMANLAACSPSALGS